MTKWTEKAIQAIAKGKGEGEEREREKQKKKTITSYVKIFTDKFFQDFSRNIRKQKSAIKMLHLRK